MLTYKKSGVDVDAAAQLVKHLKRKSTGIGGFAGLYPLNLGNDKRYSLVACTDGVGTKLKVAFSLGRHDTVGVDLVAMCVNDLITCGARPLFFLDYYATGKLDVTKSKKVVDGILEGCRQAGIPLLGGETAEMPGFYPTGEYDLAGFSVGLVERRSVVDGNKIFPGDLILGLPSSGVHANGYSMVRRVFRGKDLAKRGDELIAPTRIYVDDVQRLIEGLRAEDQIVLGMAHITGGGIPENLPRVLPKRCKAIIHKGAWDVPEIFHEIQRRGKVSEEEMWKTFNMGLGMLIVIRPNSLQLARRLLPSAQLVGRIVSGRPRVIFE